MQTNVYDFESLLDEFDRDMLVCLMYIAKKDCMYYYLNFVTGHSMLDNIKIQSFHKKVMESIYSFIKHHSFTNSKWSDVKKANLTFMLIEGDIDDSICEHQAFNQLNMFYSVYKSFFMNNSTEQDVLRELGKIKMWRELCR